MTLLECVIAFVKQEIHWVGSPEDCLEQLTSFYLNSEGGEIPWSWPTTAVSLAKQLKTHFNKLEANQIRFRKKRGRTRLWYFDYQGKNKLPEEDQKLAPELKISLYIELNSLQEALRLTTFCEENSLTYTLKTSGVKKYEVIADALPKEMLTEKEELMKKSITLLRSFLQGQEKGRMEILNYLLKETGLTRREIFALLDSQVNRLWTMRRGARGKKIYEFLPQ